jgi:DnaJ-class molecular chaperone
MIDDDLDTDYELDDHEESCSTCGGDGFVDSVAEESGRWGWDDEGPGPCPNCGGSGLRKDQVTF